MSLVKKLMQYRPRSFRFNLKWKPSSVQIAAKVQLKQNVKLGSDNVLWRQPLESREHETNVLVRVVVRSGRWLISIFPPCRRRLLPAQEGLGELPAGIPAARLGGENNSLSLAHTGECFLLQAPDAGNSPLPPPWVSYTDTTQYLGPP